MASSYEISKSAEKDWEEIIRYTLHNFGKKQVHKYTEGLIKCLDKLAFDPKKHKRLNLGDYRIVHSRCQKHYIFAQVRKDKPILIIAIFHVQMTLMVNYKTDWVRFPNYL